MEGVNETTQLSWNGVAEHIQFVNNLSFKASKLGLNGDFENKYYTLKTLRDNIDTFCKVKENEISDDWERVISKSLNLKKNFSKVLEYSDRLSKKDLAFAEYKLKQISDLIPDMLSKYQRHLLASMKGYGHFPKKQDTTYMGS